MSLGSIHKESNSVETPTAAKRCFSFIQHDLNPAGNNDSNEKSPIDLSHGNCALRRCDFSEEKKISGWELYNGLCVCIFVCIMRQFDVPACPKREWTPMKVQHLCVYVCTWHNFWVSVRNYGFIYIIQFLCISPDLRVNGTTTKQTFIQSLICVCQRSTWFTEFNLGRWSHLFVCSLSCVCVRLCVCMTALLKTEKPAFYKYFFTDIRSSWLYPCLKLHSINRKQTKNPKHKHMTLSQSTFLKQLIREENIQI